MRRGGTRSDSAARWRIVQNSNPVVISQVCGHLNLNESKRKKVENGVPQSWLPHFRPSPAHATSKHFEPHRKFFGAVLSKGGERAHWGPSRTAEVVQAKGEADRWPLGSPGSSGDRWWDSALAWRGRGLAHGLGMKVHCGKAKGHWRGHCGPRVVITHLIE